MLITADNDDDVERVRGMAAVGALGDHRWLGRYQDGWVGRVMQGVAK